MRIFWWAGAIALALLIASCGSDSAPPSADTATAPPPSSTVTGAPDVPPTLTPSAALETGADSQPSAASQMLPSTWTPRAPSIPTVAPASPAPTQTPRPTRTPLPDWCQALAPITVPDASFTGHAVNLRWVPLEHVMQYRVELRNGAGMLVSSEIVEDAEYTFGGDLFVLPGVYGWEVAPLDDGGMPICFAIADEIVVRLPPE